MNDQHGTYEYTPHVETLTVGARCPHVRVNGNDTQYCVLTESVTPRQLHEAIALLRRVVQDRHIEGGLRGDVAAWLQGNAR
jgi:hypothetical protein